MVKKALCVGCNYPSKAFGLAGAVNDAFLIAGCLQEHMGFDPDNVCVLHDIYPGQKKSVKVEPARCPTRAVILQQLQWLVRGARPGDVLFFSFSGYGLQVDDLDGYEDEGYEEAILPTDFVDGCDGDYSVVTNSDIHDILMSVPPDCSATVLMDCDHATSVIDVTGTLDGQLVNGLKFQNFCGLKVHTNKKVLASHDREVWQEERARAAKARPRFQPPMEIENPRRGRLPARQAMARSSPVAFCFSAAGHGQTAMELQVPAVDGQSAAKQHGVLSWCFVQSLMELRHDCTYLELLHEIRQQACKECPRDALEEELRALKANKALFRMQQEENERLRVMEEQERRSMLEQEPQDDDDRGPCNVDEEGNVIFVEGIPPDKLAEVQTVPVYDLYQRARRDAALDPEDIRTAQLQSNNRLVRPHTLPASTARPRAANATQRLIPKRAPKKREDDTAVFTDSFEKMEAAQPPMHEIMSVEAGVTLDCQGVKKAGAQQAARGRMSRQEYARLCERDRPEKDSAVKKVQSDSRPASPEHALAGDEPQEDDKTPMAGDRTQNVRRQQLRPYLAPSLGAAGGPTSPDHNRPLQPKQYAQATGFSAGRPATAPAPISTASTPAGGLLMPPGAVQREPLSPSASGARPMLPSGVRRSDPESPTATDALLSRPASGKHGSAPGFWPKGWEDSTPIRAPRSASAAAAVQRAPAAPSWELRARQSRASLGGKPPPRYHAPQLGGSQLVGLAQPPPGATMGHGLLRSGSRNEFFYPMSQSAPRTSAAPSPGGLQRHNGGGASRWRESAKPSPTSTPARRDSSGTRAAVADAAAAG